MKKFKVLLMTTVLAVALCACGGDKPETSVGSDAGNTVVSAKEQASAKEEVAESASDKDAKEEQGGFECLPEILEASPEDRLIQIGDVLLRRDYTMTLKEAIEVLEESCVEYEFQNDDGTEFTFERLIPAEEDFTVIVLKDGEKYIYLGGENTSSEMVSASDVAVKFSNALPGLVDVPDDVYYFKGFRCDGNGLTLNSVKELMKDYEAGLREEDYDTSYVLNFSYTWKVSEGKEKEGSVSFWFDLKDGSCYKVQHY